MIYTYECPKHGEFDIIASLREMQQTYDCPRCKHVSPKVIVLGSGGIQREDPTWIRGLNPIINDEGGKPLRTIKDLRHFYATHPDIVPQESHPAIPSNIGDIHRIDKKNINKKRLKKAENFLREYRKLEIN